MTKKLLQFLLICNSIVLTIEPSIKAEEVFFDLKNGDKISGELIEEESTNTKKIMLHPILGRLEIDVDSIYEDEEVFFELKNGNTISGELIEEESTNSKKIILHPILGRLEIDVDSIYEDELPKDQKLLSGKVLIGLDGNYNQYYKNSGVSIESEVEYEGEKNLSNFEIEFNYGSQNNKDFGEKLSSYDAAISARNDYLLNDKFTVYTASDYYYYSESLAGKHDIEGSVGLGYYLLKNESSDFQISLGPALIWTEGGEDCSITTSCGDLIYATHLEAIFGWVINKHLEFDLNNTYTNADGEGDRAISSNRLKLELKFYPDVTSNLFSAIGYESIYQDLSDPEPVNEYKIRVGTRF